MALILSYILLAEGIVCLLEAAEAFREKVRQYKENGIFALTAICSAGWSICFGLLIVQQDAYKAYLCRCIGLAFTFMYLALGIALLGWWMKLKKWRWRTISLVAATGLIIYPFIIGRDDMAFSLTEYGMSYSMTSTIGNHLYTIYSIVISIMSFGMIFSYLRHVTKRRDKIFTYWLLASQIVLVIGMIFDTVFPILGIKAFPGSSLAQGVTTMIMFRTMRYSNDLRVSMEKMGGYVHELVDTPILLFDEFGMLKVWNKATEEFLGADIIKQCREDGSITYISQLFDMSEPGFDRADRKVETEAECLCREAICRIDATGIFDKFGDLLGYIAVVTDLTAERRAVYELAEAKREAESANAAKSRFLANMSHEIRTPMHAIIGFSELILKMPVEREIRGYVEDIKLASNNLLSIINDILDISKLEAGKMEIVEVEYRMSSLLKDLWVVIYPAAQRKDLEYRIELGEKIYERMYGDKAHIREVLLNILNNAVKYTKEGRVIFRIRQEVVEEQKVNLIFEVEDTGVGIKEEDKAGLFVAFAQVDKKVHYGEEGSGLGLAIASDYVQLMGGRLELESEYGKGSLFRVILPQQYEGKELLKNTEIEGNAGKPEDSGNSFHIINREILVVDDNRVNLRVAQGILKTYGLDIDSVDNGIDALSMCLKKKYDIIFMDQMMPVMDGVETMKRIRECDRFYREESKIIALTANALIQEKERLLAEGFDAYLGKPMEVDKLEQMLLEFVPADCIRWEMENQKEDQKADLSHENQEEEQRKRLQEHLKGVDIDVGLQNCGNQMETYMEVLQITLRHGWEQLKLLKTLQEEKNYEDYTIKVHALKSTAANIGAGELSELAKEQEQMGKQGKYEQIDLGISYLLEKYEELLNCIGGLFPKQESGEKEAITEQQVQDIKEELLRLTYEFDMERMEKILDEAEYCELKPEDKQLFDGIRLFLMDFEIEEIRDRLTKSL